MVFINLRLPLTFQVIDFAVFDSGDVIVIEINPFVSVLINEVFKTL